jgi:ribosome-binding factor A
MPELKFFLARSFDYGTHIDKLLASLRADNGSDHPTAEE